MAPGITNFLLNQRDCLQFFLGLFFVYLAAVTFTLYQERGKQEKFPWQWLGLFALGQIAFQWLTMFFSLFPWGGLWELLRALTLFLSYLSLGFFVSGYLKAVQEQRSWWRLWPLSIIFVVGALFVGREGFYLATRYLLGLPVGVIAASVFYHEGEKRGDSSARHLKIAGSGLLVFALLLIVEVPPSSLLPAAWLNYQNFASFFILPVQFFQMAGVVILTGALWNYLDFKQQRNLESKPGNRLFRQAMVWLMALILVGGFMLTFVLANYSRGLLLKENYSYLSVIVEKLHDEFDDAEGIARSLSGSPYIIGALARPDKRSLALANSVLDRYQRSFNKGVCYLLDLQGMTLASSNRMMPDSFVGKNYAFRPYFQKALKGGLGRFIGRGLTSGIFGYYAAYPVYVADQIKGVVVVKVNLDQKILGQHHYLALLGPDNEVLIPSDDFRLLIGEKEERWADPAVSGPAYIYRGVRFSSLELPVAEGEWRLRLIFADDLVSYFKLFARVVTLLFVLMFMTGNYFIRKLELIGLRIAEDEKRYRALFEKSAEGIFLLNIKDAQIIEANQAGAQMHGCSVEEIKKHKMTDFDTPENKAKAPARLDLMKEGEWLGGEIDHLKLDGTPFPIEWQAGPVEISGQKYVLAFIRDITERKQAAERLRQSRELLQTVISNFQGVVFSVDNKGTFLLSEGKSLATLGLKAGEVVGRSVFEVYKDIPEIIKGMELALSGQNWQGEVKVGAIVFDVFVVPVFDQQGRVVGATGVATDITERKRGGEEIFSSRQKLEITLKSIGDAVISVDVAGQILLINRVAEKLTGWGEKEAIGRRLDEVMRLVDEQTGQPRENPVIAALRDKKTVEMGNHTVLISRGDKARYVLEDSAAPIISGSGNVEGAVIVFRDVTEKKKIERALRDNEERFRGLVNNIPGIVYRCANDPAWTMSYISGEVERLTGYPASDYLNNQVRTFVSIIHPADRALVSQAIAQAIKEKRSYEIVYRLLHKSGSFSWVQERGVGEYNEKGEVLWLDGVIVDINKQKQAEEEAQHLSLAIEQSPASVVITNQEGNITYVNPKFCQVTGYSYGEALGKNPRILKSNEQPVEFYRQLWETITSGKEWHGEFHNKKKNGELYWEMASISPLFNERKEITHFVAIKEDITERKRVEAELKAKNAELERLYKVKSNFTSAVSHELRTPLTSIKEGIALVLDGAAGPINSSQQEFLEIAKRNVDRLHRLINDVLDFSKLEMGKMTFNLRRGSLLPVIKEVIEAERVVAGQKGLPIILEAADDLPEVSFDSDRIAQVANNLLNNAIKFTEQGKITVYLQKDLWNGGVKVGVADTGRGIEPDDLAKLFQEYQQGGGILERKTGGTGLGLVISKQIVEKHQGKIWVESVPGQGSTFWFTLPPAV